VTAVTAVIRSFYSNAYAEPRSSLYCLARLFAGAANWPRRARHL